MKFWIRFKQWNTERLIRNAKSHRKYVRQEKIRSDRYWRAYFRNYNGGDDDDCHCHCSCKDEYLMSGESALGL